MPEAGALRLRSERRLSSTGVTKLTDVAGLAQRIEPEVKCLGYDLVRVAMIGGTSDPTLQVMAERPDTRQLDLADCETISRRLSEWLDSNDPRVINNVLGAIRNIVPADGTSLVNALIAIRTINPQPDQIILITDGLPTQGSVPPSRKFINVRDREKLFDDAAKTVTRDLPMDIVLLPMKGDLLAAHAYWRLARKTGGSYVIPSRDWP